MFRGSSLFINMANQGYSAGFLLFLLFLPLLVGVTLSLYLALIKKMPSKEWHQLLSISTALDIGWAFWMIGFSYVAIGAATIGTFIISKIFLELHGRAYRSIHKDYYRSSQEK